MSATFVIQCPVYKYKKAPLGEFLTNKPNSIHVYLKLKSSVLTSNILSIPEFSMYSFYVCF